MKYFMDILNINDVETFIQNKSNPLNSIPRFTNQSQNQSQNQLQHKNSNPGINSQKDKNLEIKAILAINNVVKY